MSNYSLEKVYLCFIGNSWFHESFLVLLTKKLYITLNRNK